MNDLSYNNWTSNTDKMLQQHLGRFVQWHRLQQNKSQDDVAHRAGISRSTLSLLERGETVRLDSFIQVLRVLDLLFVMDTFSVQDQISPIAYAKLKQNERKHAGKQRNKNKQAKKTKW